VKDFFSNIDFESNKTYLKIVAFILVANIIGTNIFIPHYFTFEFAWRIWTWSLIADLVFIITMSASLLIPLELHSRSNFVGKTPIFGLLSGVMVYLGYMLSWFFVCSLSDEWSMADYEWVFHGYWGAIACMLLSMSIMSMNQSSKGYGVMAYECPECEYEIIVAPHFSGETHCSNCSQLVLI